MCRLSTVGVRVVDTSVDGSRRPVSSVSRLRSSTAVSESKPRSRKARSASTASAPECPSTTAASRRTRSSTLVPLDRRGFPRHLDLRRLVLVQAADQRARAHHGEAFGEPRPVHVRDGHTGVAAADGLHQRPHGQGRVERVSPALGQLLLFTGVGGHADLGPRPHATAVAARPRARRFSAARRGRRWRRRNRTAGRTPHTGDGREEHKGVEFTEQSIQLHRAVDLGRHDGGQGVLVASANATDSLTPAACTTALIGACSVTSWDKASRSRTSQAAMVTRTPRGGQFVAKLSRARGFQATAAVSTRCSAPLRRPTAPPRRRVHRYRR